MRILEAQEELFRREDFAEQLAAVYDGASGQEGKSFLQRIDGELELLAALKHRHITLDAFVLSFINHILQPCYLKPEPHLLTGFTEERTKNPYFFDSFAWELKEREFDIRKGTSFGYDRDEYQSNLLTERSSYEY